MPIERKDLERIERIILRSTGDIAEVIGNAIERLDLGRQLEFTTDDN